MKNSELLQQIENDPLTSQDVVIDHGYSGIIDKEHIRDIIGTVRVNIVSRRMVYLEEFKKGQNYLVFTKLWKIILK